MNSASPRCAASGYAAARGAIAALHRVAKVVERGARRDQRFLVRGQRLGHVDGDAFVVAARWLAEDGGVALAQGRPFTHRLGHLRQVAAHLARLEQRAQALGPQAVVGTVPAEPALPGQVRQAQRVAIAVRHAACGRPAIGEAGARPVAAGARDLGVGRQVPVVEQQLTEGDGRRLPGHAVRRIARDRRRPRAEGDDARDVGMAQRRRQRLALHRQAQQGRNCADEPPLHSTCKVWLRRCTVSPRRTSKISCQRPGMCSSSPSAR